MAKKQVKWDEKIRQQAIKAAGEAVHRSIEKTIKMNGATLFEQMVQRNEQWNCRSSTKFHEFGSATGSRYSSASMAAEAEAWKNWRNEELSGFNRTQRKGHLYTKEGIQVEIISEPTPELTLKTLSHVAAYQRRYAEHEDDRKRWKQLQYQMHYDGGSAIKAIKDIISVRFVEIQEPTAERT